MGARTVWRAMALGSLIVLVASGCGDDETDETNAGTPTPTTAQPTTAASAPDDRAVADNDSSQTSSPPVSEVVAEDHDSDVGAPHDDEADHDDRSSDLAVTEASPNDGVDLVVPVVMHEFGYRMPEVDVSAGATVRFEFVNEGAIVHEAMLGDAHQQGEFAAAGGHDGGHGEADHHGDVSAITLEAGESGSLVVTFDEPGEMMIGCHIPGHWDAGMSAEFTVS